MKHLILAGALALAASTALADGPVLMTDAEMDQVTGGIDISIRKDGTLLQELDASGPPVNVGVTITSGQKPAVVVSPPGSN